MKEINIDKNAYVHEQKTISGLKANVYGVLLMMPAFFLCYAIYVISRGGLGAFNIWLVLVEILILIILHELVHGAFWGLFCEEGRKSIKFGIILKALTPYCHCEEFLTVRQYRLGSIAPLILTGIVPFVVSLVIGSTGLMYTSLLMIIGGGGDVYVLLMLRKEKRDVLIKDHDSLIGYIVYRPL